MSETTKTIGLTRDQMAERAARDIPDGAYVNLGIGIPELVASHVPLAAAPLRSNRRMTSSSGVSRWACSSTPLASPYRSSR